MFSDLKKKKKFVIAPISFFHLNFHEAFYILRILTISLIFSLLCCLSMTLGNCSFNLFLQVLTVLIIFLFVLFILLFSYLDFSFLYLFIHLLSSFYLKVLNHNFLRVFFKFKFCHCIRFRMLTVSLQHSSLFIFAL